MVKRSERKRIEASGASMPGAAVRERIAYLKRPSQFGTDHLKALKPGRVASILSDQAGGDLESFVDLADKMFDTDEQLLSVVGTHSAQVVSREFVVEPADHPDVELAKAGAEIAREALEAVDDIERLFGDLQYAEYISLAALEHDWEPEGRLLVSKPFWVDPRNLRFGPDWSVQVRDRRRRWINVPDESFIVHAPRTRSTVPTKSALLRSVVWVWLFKYWAWTFWVNGAERMGNPLLLGKVDSNIKQDPRKADEAREVLEELSADHAAVLGPGITVEGLDLNYAANGEVWERLIARCDFAMAKGILGSTLNVEVGETGGAYNAALSQAEETMLPRAIKAARLLASTVERDWLKPLMRVNAHLTNGRVAPTPKLRFVFDREREIQPHVFQALLDTGSLKRNQLLEIAGLPQLEGDRGEEFIQPVAKAPPSFAQRTSAGEPGGEPPDGGGGSHGPFVRESRRAGGPRRKAGGSQLTLPGTAPTSSPSQQTVTNPLRKVLYGS